MKNNFDRIDIQILKLLQENAKILQSEIASSVNLSLAAINERIKKLEKSGIIKKYVAVIDGKKLNINITAFIDVFVEHPKYEERFMEIMNNHEEVQECHRITGDFSFHLKVKVSSIEDLENFVINVLNSIEGVRQTKTYIVLSTSKETVSLPFKLEKNLIQGRNK
ncbi:MAG: Lrp/AsnC family transcriptional regulator [Candidatus Aminicenantia bacterium]